MHNLNSISRQARESRSLMILFLVCLLSLPGLLSVITNKVAAQGGGNGTGEQIVSVPPGQAYRQTNFISDIPGFAFIEDPFLVNPWGITVRGTSPFWIANNGLGNTQLVRGDVGGAPVTLNPSPQTIIIQGGAPTGVVGNTTSDFKITPPGGGTPAPALFIFDSIAGNILGWNGSSGTTAQVVVNNLGHVYTGLAIGANAGGNKIYAADFANNHIDVFDGTFTPVTLPPPAFVDATIPAGFNVHNIQNLGGSLYVTYAKIGSGLREVNGPGLGFVRKFNTDGVRDPGFAINNGQLDAPWGLAIAPASFGIFGGALLVGNFSDNGTINAYNPSTGAFLGTLKNEANQNIVIDQLWGLQFGDGGQGGDVNTLYFTAGTAEENHGLFGKLNPTTATATSLIQFATTNFSVDEAAGHVDFTVVRTGDTSGTATVNYDTFDDSGPGNASQKSDYELAAGTLTFNPGETTKTFRIMIVDDKFAEGDEVINLALSNPTGFGVGLGSPNTATVTILDNDTSTSSTNPIDDPSFFVRQHYLDFFNREPDTAGFNSFVSQITACGSNTSCINTQRNVVSTAFFNSPEFMGNGSLVVRTWKAAFGNTVTSIFGIPPLTYGQFEIGLQRILRDVVTGAPGVDAQLEANKQAFFNAFVRSPQFVAAFPTTMTPAQFVDALFTNAGVTPLTSERNAAIAEFGSATDTSDQAARARALRDVAQNTTFTQNEAARNTVLLGFFGYLRRDADTVQFNNVLNRLNSFGGDINRANLAEIFLTDGEYRQRFGLDGTPHNNAAPVANNDTATTDSLTPVSINVVANDTDPNGDFIFVSGVTTGTGGTPTINADGRTITFTPAAGFAGTASFQYTITDNGFDCVACGPNVTAHPLSATATVTVNVTSAGTFQFSSSTYSVVESAGHLTITVTRNGDSSVPVSVDFTTSDTAGLAPCSTVAGIASSRCDYETASGTLSFAAGEVSKTFDIFIIDDSFAEGAETFSLMLSNPKGTNFSLASPFSAVVTITDNDATTGANPIAGNSFFVRQQYIDFLNREPDPPGFNGWLSLLNNCTTGNTSCDRVTVSSDFYLSNEFQIRGYFIYRFYRAALGRNPTYKEFMMDLSRVSGFLTDAQLEANKVAFVADFMTRPEFATKYGGITDPTAYVKALEQTAGVTLSNEQTLITGLQNSTETRATVLRKFVESNEVATKFFNEAFVVEAYFGYLRRDPDAAFQTWVQILNQNNDRRALVSGFVNSNEYVQRFGP